MEQIGINVEQAAKILGISKSLMTKLTKEVDFPCIRFRRRIVINKELLPEWFKNHSGKFFLDY